MIKFDHFRSSIVKIIGDAAAGKINAFNAADDILNKINMYSKSMELICFDPKEAKSIIDQLIKQFPKEFKELQHEQFKEDM